MGAFLKQLSNFVMASLQGAFDPNHNAFEKMKEMELREARQLDRAEAMTWKMYNLTKDPKYLDRLEKIYEKQGNLLMANNKELRQMYKEMKNLVKELKDRHYASTADVRRIRSELATKSEKLQQQHKEATRLQAQKVAEQVDRIQAHYRENYLQHGKEALGLNKAGLNSTTKELKDLKKEVENAKQELKNAIEKAKDKDTQKVEKEGAKEEKDKNKQEDKEKREGKDKEEKDKEEKQKPEGGQVDKGEKEDRKKLEENSVAKEKEQEAKEQAKEKEQSKEDEAKKEESHEKESSKEEEEGYSL